MRSLYWIVHALSACSLAAWLASCVSEPEEMEETAEQAVGTPSWPIGGISPGSCYHTPGSGAHKPSGGIGNADDTYALDLNCAGGSEGGRPAQPIRPGTVRALGYGGSGSSSYVLIEHPEYIVVDGLGYASFYTAYLHLSGISVAVGTPVSTYTTLGSVSSVGAGSAVHLHFAAYVGEYAGSTWGRLRSFNPALLGGEFSAYDYAPYVYKRWVDDAASGGAQAFVVNGPLAYVETSLACGMHGSTRSTTTVASPPDINSFEFKWNAPVPATRQYYVWPFVPSCRGTTTRAVYKALAGGSVATSSQAQYDAWTVNQAAIFNDYAFRSKRTIAAGSFVTLRVGDYTGEAGELLAGDYAVLFWKADHCLGGCASAPWSERQYCLQPDYATSNGGSWCQAWSSLPYGY